MAVEALPVMKLYNSPFLNWLFGIQLFIQLFKNNIFFDWQVVIFERVFRAYVYDCLDLLRRMIILYIAIFLFLGYSFLIIYYWTGWRSIPGYAASIEKPTTTLSVIIPARN